MWKKTLFPLSVTFLLISVSCIFQNDPLAPNKPPEIVSFFPKARDLLVIAPDTCVFAVNAKDPDGDYLVFNYYVNDSLVSTDDTLIYYACDSGEYRVKCKVMDNSSYVENEWNLRVQLKENKPPEITWYFPEESKFSAAVGDTLEFYIIARDDDPASLEYMFIADSLVVLKGSQELFYRFLNRGDFLVNTFSLERYDELISRGRLPIVAWRRLSPREHFRYYLLTKLFGMELDPAGYRQRFHADINHKLRWELAFFRSFGLVEDNGQIRLTRRGMYPASVMMKEFFTALNGLREYFIENRL